MQPSSYRVARSLAITAPPDAVFPHMNDLKKWEAWNPWGKADPNMKLTYGGPASGVGAGFSACSSTKGKGERVGGANSMQGRGSETPAQPSSAPSSFCSGARSIG